MQQGMCRGAAALVLLFLVGSFVAPTRAQTTTSTTASMPPPRTIADITAILEQQKPNPELVAQRKRIAESLPPANAKPAELGQFYYTRALAKLALGQVNEALADAEQALPYAQRPSPFLNRVQQFIAGSYMQSGDFKKALPLQREREKLAQQLNASTRMSTKSAIVRAQVGLGDRVGAEATLKEFDALIAEIRKKASAEDLDLYAGSWQASVEHARGTYLSARGLWKDAEESLVKAEAGYRDAIAKRRRWPNGPDVEILQGQLDNVIGRMAEVKRVQGRLSDAEVDARRVLLDRLARVGKYHPSVARYCLLLGAVLRDEGRFAEVEFLSRQALDILRQAGFADNSAAVGTALGAFANSLRLQERWSEAAAAYDEFDKAARDWSPDRNARAHANPGIVLTYYNTGRIEQGIALATSAAATLRARYGEQNFQYAIAEGNLGIGLALAGRDDEAMAAFGKALPILRAEGGGADGDSDSTMPGARQRLAVRILAAYIGLLARKAGGDADDVAARGFELSDLMRGHSVAGAIAASSARAASQDPALAALARAEQDLRKRTAADFDLLNATLALPPEKRDDGAIANLREEVARLREQHAKVRVDIGVRFPEYADLIDPKPATATQIQAALRPDEAFVSFYFGADRGFVWVVPKAGAIAFAAIDVKGADIDRKVKKLREALEPNAASIADIPAFDVALAHELYTLLLKPVEGAWRPAHTLIVATNGALGSLPLGVLPTAPATLPSDQGAAFAAYRGVPWLARSHAVVTVPSAASFRTLRSLPAAGMGREPLIGFGDPLFSGDQASDSQKQNVPPPAKPNQAAPLERRSAPHTDGLASATLASLPRLPDTAEELRSVATALRVNPDRVLKLGTAASEENVEKADLAKYRVVAFATHGLTAGELNGLTQPALALSAPEVTGGSGDGLLRLEEILTLKLNADWVVLSACNTGSGEGAGAEAASGLGRAFFYAGTRALLVTNWSVHSQSARELVTDLFRRQAADPKLSRAEALRKAELTLMDGPGYLDDEGKPVFTYAHPLFWAPYSIIGDGG